MCSWSYNIPQQSSSFYFLKGLKIFKFSTLTQAIINHQYTSVWLNSHVVASHDKLAPQMCIFSPLFTAISEKDLASCLKQHFPCTCIEGLWRADKHQTGGSRGHCIHSATIVSFVRSQRADCKHTFKSWSKWKGQKKGGGTMKLFCNMGLLKNFLSKFKLGWV